jgi:hypothetical protein
MILELNPDGALVRSRYFSHDKDALPFIEDVDGGLNRFRD